MEKFCAIIPDRGDRPEFLAHCIMQMERQTLRPDKIYLEGPEIKPVKDIFDLIKRVRRGIIEAIRDGIDICYIIENDDYYPDNYFGKMFISHYDFIGIPKSIYYNIRVGKIAPMEHEKNSSLFCTGFRISALKGFTWPPDDYLSLDLRLWDFARERAIRLKDSFIYRYPAVMPIGIKHGIGFCGGTGHNENFPLYKEDPNLEWLWQNTRTESFDFYKSIFDGTPGAN